MVKSKSFKDWTQYDLEQTFGLVRKSADQCGVLKDWLSVEDSISDAHILSELDRMISDLSE